MMADDSAPHHPPKSDDVGVVVDDDPPPSSSSSSPVVVVASSSSRDDDDDDDDRPIPLSSYRLSKIRSLPGNDVCVECDRAPYPDWASVTYGTLLCIDCAGLHRGLGVQLSFVRSLTMDSWTNEQYGRMVRGGNARWRRDRTMAMEEAITSSSDEALGGSRTMDDGKGGGKEGKGTATATRLLRARYDGDAARAYRDRLTLDDAKTTGETDDDAPPGEEGRRGPDILLPPPRRRRVVVVAAAEERPPTLRETSDLIARTAFDVARRSTTARYAMLAYATMTTSIAYYGASSYVGRRATTTTTTTTAAAVDAVFVVSSLPNVNPAVSAMGHAGVASSSSSSPRWWRFGVVVGSRPDLIAMCAAVLLVGMPCLLLRRFARGMARKVLDNRQGAFNSAKNLLADLVDAGRARRLGSCDAYYPPAVAPGGEEEEEEEGGHRAKCGLVLYPGALVDRTAYAPVAALLSDMGVLVVVVNLEPHRIVPTLFDYPLREKIMRAICDSSLSTDLGTWTVDEWAIGGHSMGGHMAIAAVANELSSTVKKVVLWGVLSYPDPSTYLCGPLREIDGVEALVVNGSNDGIISGMGTKDKATTFEARMPPRSGSSLMNAASGSTRFVTIEGGNHSGCAHYGPQMYPVRDGTRTITMYEQQRRTAEVTADFLLGRSGSSRLKSD